MQWDSLTRGRLLISALVVATVVGLSLPASAESSGAVDADATSRISGRVTDSNGSPVPDVAVWAYRASDGWLPTLQAASDASGHYVLDGAKSGIAYRIKFAPPGGSSLVPEWYGGPKRRSGADVLLTDAQPVDGIDAELATGGSITGFVVAQTGPGSPAVANARVWAYRSDDRIFGSYVVLTKADGTFRIDGLDPTTEFRIRIEAPAGSDLESEWFDDTRARSRATPIVVTAGETHGQTLLVVLGDAPSLESNVQSVQVLANPPTVDIRVRYSCEQPSEKQSDIWASVAQWHYNGVGTEVPDPTNNAPVALYTTTQTPFTPGSPYKATCDGAQHDVSLTLPRIVETNPFIAGKALLTITMALGTDLQFPIILNVTNVIDVR